MKKLSLVIMALVVGLVLAGCKTTKDQDAVNESFKKVYSNYSGIVNLDGAENYTVAEGDTLTSIAKAKYGPSNGYYFPLIMVASKNVSDPELISPGATLVIPDYNANINDKAQAAKLKPYFKDIAGVYKLKDTPGAADIREQLLLISEDLGK
ncbi:MAG: LysM peptidoglycan-binding domain-containing protein [Treponema sp.]|nr:LysM peptidoglycan-binding domain-containing protein [Treponema sp.]